VSQLPRRLVRLSAILVGLLLIGLAVLQLPSVRRRVLERARGYAAQELGITLQASSLGYSLLSRSIELRDVSASAAQDPFLTAERVSVELGPGIFLGASTSPGFRSSGRNSFSFDTLTAP
jgi:hypothetical protein